MNERVYVSLQRKSDTKSLRSIRKRSLMVKKSTKRIENSNHLRDCMAESLIRLMEKKNITDIAVKEITDDAGVGRVTWFRLFESKEDALGWHMQRLWEEYLKKKGYGEKKPSDQENGELFIHFTYENRELLKLIFHQGEKYALFDAYERLILPEDSQDVLAAYISRCAAYAVVGIVDEWVRRDFRETPDQLLALQKAALKAQSAF